MRIIFFFFSLLIISCSIKKEKEQIKEQIETLVENERVINSGMTFEETQDSLRTLILESKPNEHLKSNIVLQELYIRGLVNKIDDKIKFSIPFNLHGFDCGALDCFSTNVSFEITSKDSIEFPKKINLKLQEYGCGIEGEITESGIFELIEQSPKYVNYYSKKQRSNLVIIGETRKLYYFPNIKPNSIRVDLIEKIINEYDEENENSIIPYQSTIMRTNEYENFIKKK